MSTTILFGTTVRDVISNFTGKVIGHAEYLYANDQYLVVSTICVQRGKAPESIWFDAGRLEIISVAD